MNRAVQSYDRQRATGAAERRRGIVEEHAGLVQRVARRIARMAPGVMELEDLFAAGIIGLLQAADSYDPAGGRAFPVYAEFRVKGAILDELRSRDPLPRRTRHRVNLARRAVSHTRLLRGRDPTDEELATALATDVAEVRELRQYLDQPVHVDAYDERVGVPVDLLPSDLLAEREQAALLKEGLQRLPDRFRTVVGLYYDEGLNYRQIGQVLGKSEATICRMHKEGLRRLKEIVASLPAQGLAHAQPAPRHAASC
jgi:RNA polymerase sigma factor for flagellar operon FliA